jgi:hypothetical protein
MGIQCLSAADTHAVMIIGSSSVRCYKDEKHVTQSAESSLPLFYLYSSSAL